MNVPDASLYKQYKMEIELLGAEWTPSPPTLLFWNVQHTNTKAKILKLDLQPVA